MRARVTLAAALGLVPSVLPVACGGGSAESRPAASPVTHGDTQESTERSPARGAAAAPAPRKPRCDDGSCFACGDGICPSGFYCDESASGGATCSWVPACTNGATCECVTRALGSAHCESAGGGAHVRD